MSDTEETRKDLPQGESEMPVDPTEDAAGEPKRRRGSALPLVLSLIAVLLAGGGIGAGYWVWQQMRLQTAAERVDLAQLYTRLNTLQTRLGEQASQQAVSALRDQVTGLDRQMKTQAQTLNTLARAIAQSRTLAQRNQRGWSLAEVQYLMRIARYRLDLMNDYPGSIAALKAADQRLAALADPNLLPVRQALAKEIAELRDFKKPDRVGIMLELTQLADHLKDLLPAQPTRKGTVVDTATQPEARTGWRGLFDKVWSVIAKNITVRHYDQPVQGPPTADAQLYLNQVLSLRLEAAGVAVMSANNAAYHHELQAALDWLDSHYAPKPAAAVKQQLQALLARNIAPAPPNIGASLKLLRKLGDGTQASKTS